MRESGHPRVWESRGEGHREQDRKYSSGSTSRDGRGGGRPELGHGVFNDPEVHRVLQDARLVPVTDIYGIYQK